MSTYIVHSSKTDWSSGEEIPAFSFSLFLICHLQSTFLVFPTWRFFLSWTRISLTSHLRKEPCQFIILYYYICRCLSVKNYQDWCREGKPKKKKNRKENPSDKRMKIWFLQDWYLSVRGGWFFPRSVQSCVLEIEKIKTLCVHSTYAKCIVTSGWTSS